MFASRVLRAGSALGQLLLVVVLALGVFVMHTVGHPDTDSGSASHSMAVAGLPHEGMADTAGPAAQAPLDGMDMAALCVAVLFGGWALAALLRHALARRPDGMAVLRARLISVPPARPPPRPPELSQLSVLRI